MDDNLQSVKQKFTRYIAGRKHKREAIPLDLRQEAVDLMRRYPPFIVADTICISRPVLYKWRKELAALPRISNPTPDIKPAVQSAFFEVVAPMVQEPSGPTAVWEHPHRGRLVLSGLTASVIPALIQGFLGEVAP